MTGRDFIRKVRKLGKQEGIAVAVDEARGKGSHITLYYGKAFTVVRNPRDELKKGTLAAMCRQLGIDKAQL